MDCFEGVNKENVIVVGEEITLWELLEVEDVVYGVEEAEEA